MQIPLSRPDITEKEIEAVLGVLRTPYLSLGPKLTEFEAAFADYIGTRFASAVSSGTAGLHLAIKALDIKERNEVITTPFSFISSANVMLYERATPVFVDIEHDTLNLDPEKIQEFIDKNCEFDGKALWNKVTKRQVKAMLVVHIFGHPAKMEKIMDIAEKYNLKVIEDACEAMGAEYRGKKVGTFGEIAVFAFYPNKQITTGEGGMVVSDNEEIDKLIKSLRNQGRQEAGLWLEHVRLGYNYRMDEISAALGLVQTKRISEILEKRKKVAELYNEALKNLEEIKLPYVSPDVKISWWVYVIKVKDKFNRDKLMQYLHDNGIGVRPYFPPIHLQKFYKESFEFKEGDFPITEEISKRTISIPFHNNLSETEINYTTLKIKEGIFQFLKSGSRS